MISKTLSTSQRRAALHQVVPDLAEFCQQLYPLLVSHADDFGRLPGDAFTVKHAIDPTSPRGLDEFERALAMLDQVGMAHRASHFPHQLSGGEMQRAAIARALIHTPSLLLADEPTGNLDSGNASQVLEVIAKIASLRTTTVIMVTHSDSVAAQADRRIQMKDGRIAPEAS